MTRVEPRLLMLGGGFCAVLTIVGVVVYLTAPAVDFSWFAYSPDPPRYVSSSTLSARQITGLVVAALGLVGVSATAGYVLGRKAAARRPR